MYARKSRHRSAELDKRNKWWSHDRSRFNSNSQLIDRELSVLPGLDSDREWSRAQGRATRMTEIMQREVKGEGDLFFREGDEANCAYIIQSGEVEIFMRDGDRELSLSRIGKNGLFGELGLLDSGPRSASARATCLTTVIVVSRPKFEQKLAKADPFLKALLSMLAERLRFTSVEAFSLATPHFGPAESNFDTIPAE